MKQRKRWRCKICWHITDKTPSQHERVCIEWQGRQKERQKRNAKHVNSINPSPVDYCRYCRNKAKKETEKHLDKCRQYHAYINKRIRKAHIAYQDISERFPEDMNFWRHFLDWLKKNL